MRKATKKSPAASQTATQAATRNGVRSDDSDRERSGPKRNAPSATGSTPSKKAHSETKPVLGEEAKHFEHLERIITAQLAKQVEKQIERGDYDNRLLNNFQAGRDLCLNNVGDVVCARLFENKVMIRARFVDTSETEYRKFTSDFGTFVDLAELYSMLVTIALTCTFI